MIVVVICTVVDISGCDRKKNMNMEKKKCSDKHGALMGRGISCLEIKLEFIDRYAPIR